MRPHHGQPLLPLVRDNQGFILIVSVLLISVVMSIIGIATALATLTHLEQSVTHLRGQDSVAYTHGCMDEALLRLHRDATYMGESLTYGVGSCTMIISGSGNTRALTATGTVNTQTHSVTAAVTLVPYALTRWDS